MDWKNLVTLGGLVFTIVVAVGAGAWWINEGIHASERRTTAHIRDVKDDLSKLQTEVGYIKGRLDPLKLVDDEAE